MSGDGQLRESEPDGHVLHFSGRVLSWDDLRHGLNGHHRVVVPERAVVTPLAEEFLREKGVELARTGDARPGPYQMAWGYAQDRVHPLVQSAVQAAAREGVRLELLAAPNAEAHRWAQAVAECVRRGECQGGILFCCDPGLVCCVANKVAGLRAVAVTTVGQTAQAMLALAPNLVAVEMPGRTFFELKQILWSLCGGVPACPPGVACTLKELDGHAHR